jgi:hypothetical protein
MQQLVQVLLILQLTSTLKGNLKKQISAGGVAGHY